MFLSDDGSTSSNSSTNQPKVMSLEELVTATELDENDVVSAVQYWIRQQVVRECEPPMEKKAQWEAMYGGYIGDGSEDLHCYEIIEDQ